MKALLGLCLAVSLTVMAAAHRHQSTAPQRSSNRVQSSAPRSFLFYVKERMKNVSLEKTELKEKINDCCSQADCTYDMKTYANGAVFTAADECNLCRCNNGAVTCTNSSSCNSDQVATEEASYKDVVAQAYCSSRSFGLEHYGFPISAVRRNCEFAPNQTCNDICGPESAFATSIEANFPDLDIPAYICLGALWLMLDHPILAPNPGPGQTDAGLLNMVTISYDDCEDTGCGPNYCCCSLTDR